MRFIPVTILFGLTLLGVGCVWGPKKTTVPSTTTSTVQSEDWQMLESGKNYSLTKNDTVEKNLVYTNYGYGIKFEIPNSIQICTDYSQLDTNSILFNFSQEFCEKYLTLSEIVMRVGGSNYLDYDLPTGGYKQINVDDKIAYTWDHEYEMAGPEGEPLGWRRREIRTFLPTIIENKLIEFTVYQRVQDDKSKADIQAGDYIKSYNYILENFQYLR